MSSEKLCNGFRQRTPYRFNEAYVNGLLAALMTGVLITPAIK